VINADGTVLTDIESFVAGHPYVCARRTNGELLCWGANMNGDPATARRRTADSRSR
jgi:hypothetical protein